jgi:hypothetical protein
MIGACILLLSQYKCNEAAAVFGITSGWKILIVRLGERERYGLYKSFVDIPVEDQYN